MLRPSSRPNRGGGTRNSFWHLWWLNPVAVFSIILITTSVPAYLIPDALYQLNWSTPKFIGLPEFLYVLYVVAAFAAGACLVGLISDRTKHLEATKVLQRLYLPWNGIWLIFYVSFVVILAAYAIWLLLLMSKGLSIGAIIAGLRGEQGAAYDIRGQGETLPGVTTLVQLEMGFLIVGLILGFKFGWKGNFKKLLLPLIIVVVVTWMRSKIWSERLALIELVVPGVVLLARLSNSENWKPWQRTLTAITPVAGPPLLFAFFSASEYSRSWSGIYSETQSSFLLFSFMRLTGYYVTALNNGAAMVQVMHHYNIPYQTLDWFWRFPLVKSLMPYETLANAQPGDDYQDLLDNLANPEFNNPSGVFVVRLDYGYVGGLFAWFAFGMLAAWLYRGFVRGSLSGLLLYPFFFVGLLESPLVFYWSLSRSFPTWVLLFFILLLALFTSQVVRRRVRMRGGFMHPADTPLPEQIRRDAASS